MRTNQEMFLFIKSISRRIYFVGAFERVTEVPLGGPLETLV